MLSTLITRQFLVTLLTLISLSGAAHAQANDALQAFGGKEGLTQLMDDFVTRMKTDPRIGSQFKDTNVAEFKIKLRDQLCVVLNGPCEYKGADMKTAHEQLDITKTHFNALVELLQASMDAKGVAFSAQNALLAKLAPMHREVITVR
jgi:hemoglobin